MNAAEAIRVAREFELKTLVPLHYEGWKHFRQGRDEVEGAFARGRDRGPGPLAERRRSRSRSRSEAGAMRPDPDRLGGLAWARHGGGRLTSAERRRLLGEIAKGQAVNLAGRVKLALGRLPAGAAEIDASSFAPPDSKLAREAEEACAEQPAFVAGHSYRTWMFGLALAALDRSDLDPELFYCAALLHDHGIAEPQPGQRLHPAQRRPGARLRRGAPGSPPSRARRSPTRSASTRRRACGSSATARSAATSSGGR